MVIDVLVDRGKLIFAASFFVMFVSHRGFRLDALTCGLRSASRGAGPIAWSSHLVQVLNFVTTLAPAPWHQSSPPLLSDVSSARWFHSLSQNGHRPCGIPSRTLFLPPDQWTGNTRVATRRSPDTPLVRELVGSSNLFCVIWAVISGKAAGSQ